MDNSETQEMSPAAQHRLLQIARQAVEAAVRHEALPRLEADDPELKLHRGAFVTLTNAGRLRGCIGEFEATRPVAEIVQRMAVAAATEDPRFLTQPITPAELANVKVEISVLSPRKRIENPLDIVLGRDGIFIRRGNRAGTFLPQVATEHHMTKEEFLGTCCSHKMGLPEDAWKDPETEVFTYTAQVFSEKGEHK